VHQSNQAERSLNAPEGIRPEIRQDRQEVVIAAMLAGLRSWRPDLDYPQSFSDMQACVRGLFGLAAGEAVRDSEEER
jgi:hypothetical protein